MIFSVFIWDYICFGIFWACEKIEEGKNLLFFFCFFCSIFFGSIVFFVEDSPFYFFVWLRVFWDVIHTQILNYFIEGKNEKNKNQ